jgi:hypothetical protein
MTENLTELEKIEAMLDVLVWIEKQYIKIALIALPLLSIVATIASYLLGMNNIALFFFSFGAAETWIADAVMVYLLIEETRLHARRIKAGGKLTRADAVVIALNVFFVVLLSVFFLMLTAGMLRFRYRLVAIWVP